MNQLEIKPFIEAIEKINPAASEQAEALGITTRQLRRWKKGELPACLYKIPPSLLRILAESREQAAPAEQPQV